ncbi:MAG: YqgE/AlgH family protein [bacterium]
MSDFRPLFLIAMPQLLDPNFSRSVVLILDHDREGAMGLVVNHPLAMNLGDFALQEKMLCHGALQKTSVFKGGPVETDRGWVLHTDDSVEERKEIMPGLYLSTSSDSLKKLLENGSQPLRLILGYAGWAAGQLESEMKLGSWLTFQANPKDVLETDPSRTWTTVLRSMGVDPMQLISVRGVH